MDVALHAGDPAARIDELVALPLRSLTISVDLGGNDDELAAVSRASSRNGSRRAMADHGLEPGARPRDSGAARRGIRVRRRSLVRARPQARSPSSMASLAWFSYPPAAALPW